MIKIKLLSGFTKYTKSKQNVSECWVLGFNYVHKSIIWD